MIQIKVQNHCVQSDLDQNHQKRFKSPNHIVNPYRRVISFITRYMWKKIALEWHDSIWQSKNRSSCSALLIC